MRLLTRRPVGRRSERCSAKLLHDGLRRHHATLVAALMLSGCAVGPDFQVPEPPPVTSYLPQNRVSDAAREQVPGQALVRGSDISARWWELFHSRYLNQLIEQGLLHNTDLKAAEDAVRIAQANALAQRGALFPTAVADVFGGVRRQVEAADAQVNVQAFQREAVYLTLTSNITLAAIQEASLRGQIAATRRLIDLQSRLLGILRRQN